MAVESHERYQLDLSYLVVVFASWVFFVWCYAWLASWLSPKLTDAYLVLDEKTKVYWDTMVTSTVHACLVTVLGVYCMATDQHLWDHKLDAVSVLPKIITSISVGYFIADLSCILWRWEEIGEVIYIFHHLGAMHSFIYVTIWGVYPFFAVFRVVAEMSTPFINLRWFRNTVGYPRDNFRFFFLTLTITIVFFFVRFACIPVYWYYCWLEYGSDAWLQTGRTQWAMVTSCLILDCLNVFWFIKLLGALQKKAQQQKERLKTSPKLRMLRTKSAVFMREVGSFWQQTTGGNGFSTERGRE